MATVVVGDCTVTGPSRRFPAGHLRTEADDAITALFLPSADSSYTSGAERPVDGSLTHISRQPRRSTTRFGEPTRALAPDRAREPDKAGKRRSSLRHILA